MKVGGVRKAALVFIFVTVLLDVLALGLIIPVLPELVVQFTGGDWAKGAELTGVFSTVWAAMQLVFSPLFGALSDRFGRRKVILASNFGLGFDYMVMALAPSWQWLFVGRAVSGITASSIPTAFAYISDVTPPEKRAAGFGILGAAFGVGFVIGPALGGILGKVDPRLPFWVAAALSLMNALYGVFVLPESLPPERRSAFSWKRANPVGALAMLKGHTGLFGLASMNFLGYVAHVVLPSTFVLYAQYRYGWDKAMVGLALGAVGVMSLIVQGGLIRVCIAKLGERRTLLAGLWFGVAGFFVAGWAPDAGTFWVSIPLESLWGLAGPATMGLMSARVGPGEQGQLQGLNNSLRALSEIIGPTLYTVPFAYAVSAGREWGTPGIPFYLASALLAVSALVALKVAVPAPAPASAP